MGTEKVEFKLEIEEENKISAYFILAAIGLFFLIALIGSFINNRGQNELDAQYTAREWSQAVLQSNDPLKYELLNENAREQFIEELPKQTKVETNYHFENFDLIQWKKDKKNFVYKVHNYGLDSCSDCQKVIWVHVVKESNGWKIPEHHFSERQAEKFIKNLSGETVYSSVEENEDEEELSVIEQLFQKFF